MSRWSAVWRVLRAHRGPLVAIAVVSALATVLGGAALPLLDALATAGTRSDLARATPTERDLEARFAVVAPDTADPQRAFDGVADDLRAAHRSMPAALRGVTRTGEYVAQTDYLSLAALPSKVPADVSLAVDPGFAARSHIVRGRAPRAASDPDAVEIVVSAPVARAIGWPLGTTRTASGPDSTPIAMRLVGIFAADDPDAVAWDHTPSTLRAAKAPTPLGGIVLKAVAYTDDDSFGTVSAGFRTTTARAWFPLRTGRVDADERTRLAGDVRRWLGDLTPLPATASGAARFDTTLPDVLDASVARDATVGTIAAALGSGPAAALVALEVLLARLLVERDRERWALLDARGAGRRRLAAIAAALAGVAALPGAVVGAAVTWAVLGSPATGLQAAGVPGSAAVAAGAAVLVACAAAAALVPTARARALPRGTRLVVEAVVVVTAAAAVVVTVRNGLGTSAPGGSVDPVAAALPVLLAAAGVVGALRVMPTALRGVLRAARRRPDLPAFAGTAATARARADGAVPLAVATVGIAVALLGTVVGGTLANGLTDAARRTVAADVSVTAQALDADAVDRVADVTGVARVAGISTSGSVTLGTGDTAVVLVADTAALARVQAGVPGALPTPAALRGSSDGDVPVVVSAALADRIGRGTDTGGTGLRVVGTAPDTSPFTASARWLLVDERRAGEITDTGSVDRVLVTTDAGASPDRVASAVRRAVPGTSTDTVLAAARELDADPRVPGVRAVVVAAAIAGGLTGAGALAVAGLLGAPVRRARDRLLGVLGLDRRGARVLVAAESLPTLVAAAATAVVVAVASVLLLLPAADLRSFTGGVVRPAVAVDPVLLGLVGTGVVGALAVVLVVDVFAGTLGNRRDR